MNLAYVDTSYVAAIEFGEPSARTLAKRLNAFDHIVSSLLLDAELRSAMHREEITPTDDWSTRIDWVTPDRALTPEITRVLAAGHASGADCFHLACALYTAGDPALIAFLTLDQRQRKVARSLGFRT
jgi:hypothetical protein